MFIPKKCDKWGRWFAFVKFMEVDRVEELEECLKDVWWGDVKLKVNKARFEREEKVVLNQSQHRREEVVQKKVEAGLSYSGVVLGERRPEKVGGESPVLPVLEILPAEDLLSELESCFVGRLFQHLEVEALQTCLFMEGWRGIKVVPLGEKLVLVKGNNMQDIVKAREEKQAWWSATFSEVVPWSPNLVATIRRVWIQLRGIPLHI